MKNDNTISNFWVNCLAVFFIISILFGAGTIVYGIGSFIITDIKVNHEISKVCEEHNLKAGETKIINGEKIVIMNQHSFNRNMFDVRLKNGTITTVHIKEFIDPNDTDTGT